MLVNEDIGKVKVVLYTFVRRGVPSREGTYAEPSACEVGRPVPFLAAFISPVLASVQSGLESGDMRSNHYATSIMNEEINRKYETASLCTFCIKSLPSKFFRSRQRM